MKKKIFAGIAILAIAAFNLNMNQQKNSMSLLSLTNIEALADTEDVGTCDITKYSRNCRPDTKERTGSATADSSGTFKIGGMTIAGYKSYQNCSYSYDLGYCKEHTGSCCENEHVGKAFNLALKLI